MSKVTNEWLKEAIRLSELASVDLQEARDPINECGEVGSRLFLKKTYLSSRRLWDHVNILEEPENIKEVCEKTLLLNRLTYALRDN